jgi:hypothetical protein
MSRHLVSKLKGARWRFKTATHYRLAGRANAIERSRRRTKTDFVASAIRSQLDFLSDLLSKADPKRGLTPNESGGHGHD